MSRAHDSPLRMMNPSLSLYFYEPRSALAEPHVSCLRIPTVAFCSPDERRYKEFCKTGGFEVYMPCWELNELLAVGTYIRRNDKSLPDEHKELLSDENIRGRCKRFGGIFRHVIPVHAQHVAQCKKSRHKAIAQLTYTPNLRALLRQSDLGPLQISDWICQYDVARSGENAFKQQRLQLVNGEIREMLKENMEKVDLNTRIDAQSQ